MGDSLAEQFPAPFAVLRQGHALARDLGMPVYVLSDQQGQWALRLHKRASDDPFRGIQVATCLPKMVWDVGRRTIWTRVPSTDEDADGVGRLISPDPPHRP